MSIAVTLRAPSGGNSCNSSDYLNFVLTWEESPQCRTVIYTPFDILGYCYLPLKVSHIRCSPGWLESAEWWAKCKIMGGIDFCTTFFTKPYISQFLNKSLLLSKLKGDQDISMMGRTMPRYAYVPCALMNSSTVGSYSFSPQYEFIMECCRWLYWISSVRTWQGPLLGYLHRSRYHQCPLWKVAIMHQQLSVNH